MGHEAFMTNSAVDVAWIASCLAMTTPLAMAPLALTT
jgi:hypothetical protein